MVYNNYNEYQKFLNFLCFSFGVLCFVYYNLYEKSKKQSFWKVVKMSYTKGEWRVEEYLYRKILALAITTSKHQIAGIIPKVSASGLLSELEHKANAKLISAAPDLLKACEAIVRDFEAEDSKMIIDPASCIHTPNHTNLCPYWLAKQAIAKAMGKEEKNE